MKTDRNKNNVKSEENMILEKSRRLHLVNLFVNVTKYIGRGYPILQYALYNLLIIPNVVYTTGYPKKGEI